MSPNTARIVLLCFSSASPLATLAVLSSFKTKDQPLSTNTMRTLPLSRPLQLLFFYSVSPTQSSLLLPHPLLCCPLPPLLSSSLFQVYFFISSCCNFLLLAKSCVVVVFATYTFSFSIFIAKVAHPSRRPTKDSFLPAAPLPASLHHVRVTPFSSSINLAARPCRPSFSFAPPFRR